MGNKVVDGSVEWIVDQDTGEVVGHKMRDGTERGVLTTQTNPLTGLNEVFLNGQKVELGGSATSSSFAHELLVASQARVVRVGIMGTSIASSSISSTQKLIPALMGQYGRAKSITAQAGIWGGSYESAVNGWYKQPYGGTMFIRMRGSSSSTALAVSGYGDTVRVYYSKETDGGTFAVKVSGVQVGTIDCSGAQSYGNIAEFTVSRKSAEITFDPPASGYAYLEAYEIYDSESTGVVVRDYTLGGSALKQAIDIRNNSGAQVAGIAIVGDNGLDGLADPTLDYAIVQWTVNDAGAGDGWVAGYSAALNKLVAKLRANDTKVVLVAEMAGHYSRTLDNNYINSYRAIKSKILSMANIDGVSVIDWDSTNRIDDPVAYAAAYYAGPVVDPVTQAFTGDFIHPVSAGYVTYDKLLGDIFGVTIQNGIDISAGFLEMSRERPEYAPTPQIVNVDGTDKLLEVVGGTLRGLGAGTSSISVGPVVEVFYDPTATNYGSSLQAQIDASTDSDENGKYILGQKNVNVTANATYMLHLVFSGSVSLRTDNATVFHVDEYGVDSNSANTSGRTYSRLNFSGTGTRLASISLRVKFGASAAYVLIEGTTARLYSISMTKADRPVTVTGIV